MGGQPGRGPGNTRGLHPCVGCNGGNAGSYSILPGGPRIPEGQGLKAPKDGASTFQMKKLRPRERVSPWPMPPSPEDLEGGAAALSGDVCGGWTQARQREAAVTRERGRFWLGAQMGLPPAPPRPRQDAGPGPRDTRCCKTQASATLPWWPPFRPRLGDSVGISVSLAQNQAGHWSEPRCLPWPCPSLGGPE